MKIGSERLLEGTYLDLDELWSKRRVIETDMGLLNPIS